MQLKGKTIIQRIRIISTVLFRISLLLVLPFLLLTMSYVAYARYFIRQPIRIGVYLTDANKIDLNPFVTDPVSENKCPWPLPTESIMTSTYFAFETPLEMRLEDTKAIIEINNVDPFPLAVEIQSLTDVKIKAYSNDSLTPVTNEFQVTRMDIPIEAKSVQLRYGELLKHYFLGICSPEISYRPNRWELDLGWTSNLLQLMAGFDLDPHAEPITLIFGDVEKIKLDNQEINSLDKLELTIERIEPRDEYAIFGDFTFSLYAIDFSKLYNLSPGDDLLFRMKNPNAKLFWISGDSPYIEISQPSGWYEISDKRTEFGHAAATLFIEADDRSKKLHLYQPSVGDNEYMASIEGVSKNVQLDGIQLIKSDWEKLDSGVQNAYIVFAFTSIFGFIGLVVRNRASLLAFVIEPTVPRPSPLENGKLVLILLSGRKIAGIFVRTEGLSRKQYILRDLREFKDGHWGKTIKGEIRVPINQIEMEYYQNEASPETPPIS